MNKIFHDETFLYHFVTSIFFFFFRCTSSLLDSKQTLPYFVFTLGECSADAEGCGLLLSIVKSHNDPIMALGIA